jgi:hypothetical protein
MIEINVPNLPCSSMRLRIQIPNFFPRLQRAATPNLRKHDLLQMHDLLDLLGKRKLAATLAELLLARAEILMNS